MTRRALIDTHHRDAKLARAVTEDAIERSDVHADIDWREAADIAVRAVALLLAILCSDDVRLYIVEHFPEHSTHNWSALGPVMLRAERDGIIKKTGKTVYSDRVVAHGIARPEYFSLIYEGPDKVVVSNDCANCVRLRAEVRAWQDAFPDYELRDD